MPAHRFNASLWAVLSLAATPWVSHAQMSPTDAEAQGVESSTPVGSPGVATPSVLTEIPAGGVLLIPESTNDRVMAFDPITGDLIDPDFIPADPDNLSTPINAILGPDGQSILVSDQIDDVVQHYDLQGNHLGVFAPIGGANTAILDNVRGIALQPGTGHVLVTVGGGTSDDTVQAFDTDGTFLGSFIAAGSGGLDSPFDITPLAGNYLVGGITSDALHQYDASGTPLVPPTLAAVDTFAEQIAVGGPAGTILVGNFSGTQEGVMEFATDGTLIDIYNPPGLGGYRGAYELPNGNILTTNGDGVHEIDRAGNLVETKISGVSARFIEYVNANTGVAIPTLHPLALIGLAGLLVAGAASRWRA